MLMMSYPLCTNKRRARSTSPSFRFRILDHPQLHTVSNNCVNPFEGIILAESYYSIIWIQCSWLRYTVSQAVMRVKVKAVVLV
jgi:hypothetical protein